MSATNHILNIPEQGPHLHRRPQRYGRPEAYVGPGSYTNLVDRINEYRFDRAVLFMPMIAGGEDYGRPVLDGLRDHGAYCEVLPIYYDRTQKKIVQPTTLEFLRAVRHLNKHSEGGSIKLVWDDSISSNATGARAIYEWLRKHSISMNEILIGANMDMSGITNGLNLHPYYESPLPLSTLEPILTYGEENEASASEKFLAIFNAESALNSVVNALDLARTWMNRRALVRSSKRYLDQVYRKV